MSSKESLLESLTKSGWHLTPESIDQFLSENPKITTNELIRKALDCDLRNIGSKFLTEEQFQGKCEKFEANLVMQLVKLRNIAAPKENETCNTAPRMYKITLTDGTIHCNALVMNDVPKLNLNTPPGTKIFLTGTIKVKCNLLMLEARNTEVLGGEVDYLVSKWKANRDLYNHVRTFCQTDNPPPPWVPFGAKQNNLVDTSKKVFAENEKKEEEDSTSEFSQARQAALAEALEAKSKVTKTFTQLPIEKPQTDSVNPTGPRSMLAAASIPARSTAVSTSSDSKPNERKKKGGRKGRRGDRSDEEDYADVKGAAKPKEVTLFDVFKKKLDIDDAELEEASGVSNDAAAFQTQPERETRFNRGGRGGGRGGRRYGNQAPHPSQTAPKQPQKEFNLNDFNYDLSGEVAKVSLRDSVTSSSAKQAVDGSSTNSRSNQQQASSNSLNKTPRSSGQGTTASANASGGNQYQQQQYNKNSRNQGNNRDYENQKNQRGYDNNNRNNQHINNNNNYNQQQYQQQPQTAYQPPKNQPQYGQFQQSFPPPPPPQQQYYYSNYNQNPPANMYYGQPPPMGQYGQFEPPLPPLPQQYPPYDYSNQQYQQSGPPRQQNRNTYYNSGGRGARNNNNNRGSNY